MSEKKQFSYAPERLADDLYAIPLPLYDGSPVNAYIAVSDDGLWLIDGGLASDQAQTTLREGLATLGFSMRDLRGLLVTHGHTDHVGAADTVLSNGGELLAHRIEHLEGRVLTFDDAWLQRHGLPKDGGMRPGQWRDFIWPAPTRLLEDGEHVRWGNLDLQVVWCPGHTPGLICLYEAQRGLLFTTDHVMRRAPAPVSVRRAEHDNPLGDYLASVDKLRGLNARTVLPGHGRPFGALDQRLMDIEAEIAQQLRVIVDRLQHGPATAYELLEIGSLRDRRPIATRYEVSIVLARLRYLEGQGRVSAVEGDETIRFALAD